MFTHDIANKQQFTQKEGEQTFENWKREAGYKDGEFPFSFKNFRKNSRGKLINLNVVSWGFYENTSGEWVVFISYRSTDNKYTCAYHWNTDDFGQIHGEARKLEWTN